ncbi:hypothetical protein N6H14_29535 [Paenibacillus sp. CC-CFT747]|nr:hypothetical protein N6H14_29535 [Paenibacillus sp. CC-CFT747]
MRRFWLCSKGSVSVYLIMILVPVFFFHAVLIDLIRIKLAERETETAVKAGARSLLSEYDSSLRPYGLFGRDRDQEAMLALFTEVFHNNLSTPADTFSYLGNKASDGEGYRVKDLYTLANQEVFRSQVLQDMKYRAPVEFGLEFVDKFKKNGVDKNLAAASDFSENAAKLQAKADAVDEALDQAWDQAIVLLGTAKAANGKYAGRLSELYRLAGLIGLHTVEEVRQSILDTEQELKRAGETLQELSRSLESSHASLKEWAAEAKENASRIEEISASIQSVEVNIEQVQTEITEFTAKKVELQKLLENLLNYAALLQTSRGEIRLDYEQMTGEYDRLAEKLMEAQKANDELRGEKARLVQETACPASPCPVLDIYSSVPVRNDDYFSLYKTEAGKITATFSGMKTNWESTLLFIGADYERLVQANEALASQADAFKASQGALEEKRKAEAKRLNGSKEEQKKITRGAFGEARKALEGCGLWGTSDPFTGYYHTLEQQGENGTAGLALKYWSYNREEAIGPVEGTYSIDEKDISARQALSMAKRLTWLLEGFRDELYVNEYALTRFTYRTDQAVKTSSRPLDRQEAEYILYGLNSCASNYSAAYSEMFMLLFSIRTMEALADPKKELLQAGSPCWFCWPPPLREQERQSAI